MVFDGFDDVLFLEGLGFCLACFGTGHKTKYTCQVWGQNLFLVRGLEDFVTSILVARKCLYVKAGLEKISCYIHQRQESYLLFLGGGVGRANKCCRFQCALEVNWELRKQHWAIFAISFVISEGAGKQHLNSATGFKTGLFASHWSSYVVGSNMEKGQCFAG